MLRSLFFLAQGGNLETIPTVLLFGHSRLAVNKGSPCSRLRLVQKKHISPCRKTDLASKADVS